MTVPLRSRALICGAIALAALTASTALYASAQESAITFPVAELGNCADKKECHAYCDDLEHVTQCVAFAESHGLMSADDARAAREFAKLGGEGPGGCTSKEACEKYCEDPAHMRQCITFAKQAGLMEGGELEEAEKVATYIEQGGEMPGGCRGERECRAYCESGEHMNECAEFAIKMGFMSEKEAEIFRKTGGEGPGGCRGRACESFCRSEENREQCIAFAIEHDLMSSEDRARMEEGMAQARQALEKAPPEVLSCIEAQIGAEKLADIRSGTGFAGPKLGQVLPECFKNVMGGEAERGPFGTNSAARDCMRQVFGDDFEEKMRDGELDPGTRDNEIRECMQKSMGDGYLTDDGRWERPQMGEAPQSEGGEGRMPPPPGSDMRRFGPPPGENHDAFEAEMKERYGEEFEARRAEMESQMRSRIEEQMRSGNFDRTQLPPDFRPEGAFPPPESFNRPPDGGGVQPHPMPPVDGIMPGADMPARFMPPQGDMMSPSDMSRPEGAPPVMPDAPQSFGPSAFIANVISIFLSMLGGR